MKRLIIFVVTVVVIAFSVLYPHRMISPGELTEGHQKIKNECTACHKPFWGIETNRCVGCHKLEKIGMRDSSPLNMSQNQILFHSKLKNTECTSCHTDHKGVDPQTSFMHFDHALLSIETIKNCNGCHNKPLDKLHNQLSASCSSCHSTGSWILSGIFNHDVLTDAIKSNCTSCHQKPSDSFHQSLTDNCNNCHAVDRWSPSSFDHSRYFSLDNNHNAKCSTCHASSNFTGYTCFGCHEHSESKMIDEHSEEGIFNISDCASCHRSGDEHDTRNRAGENNKLNSKDVKKIKDHLRSGENKEHEEDKHDD